MIENKYFKFVEELILHKQLFGFFFFINPISILQFGFF